MEKYTGCTNPVHSEDAEPQARLFPTRVSEADFQTYKKQNIRIYGYTNRLMTQLSKYMSLSPAVFALFSADGCLLKLYGNPDRMAAVQLDGIAKGTLWSLDCCGGNAVTIGLTSQKATSTVGGQNEHPVLQKYAIYFEPISVIDELYGTGGSRLYGGIAALVPVDRSHPDYQLTVFSIANDLVLHISSGDSYYQMFESITEAFLAFDVNLKSGRVTTLYHSNTVFDVLNIDPVDIYFQPAENLFDPLPDNKELWTVIREGRSLQSKTMELRVRGEEVTCVITTIPYHQPSLNIRGILFLITTPQKIAVQTAQKMGNSAVLTFEDIIGRSPVIKSTIQKSKLLANSDSNVLLLGESGVGKDIFAQAIHNTGKRRHNPFIAVNCGALPRDLISSELFGYESGAFTGAKKSGNIGKFELANGGTLFLDEIGELPLDIQATLLRAVEQKRFTRIGGTREIHVDVRIISATNVDMLSQIEKKMFRSDLYYRLSTLRLQIPPLRERGEDIVILAEHFIRSISRRIQRQTPVILSEDAKHTLLAMPWRGNVRELQNMMEEIVQLSTESVIHSDQIIKASASESFTYEPAPLEHFHTAPKRVRHDLSREDLQAALELFEGNKSKAAQYLNVSRRTLYSKLEKLGLC